MKIKAWQKVLMVVLLVVAMIAVANAKLIWTIGSNLTQPTVPLDESTDWAGGSTYEHIAYAADSDSQYLDLYVPDSDTPAPLFVLVHGGGFVSGDSQTRQAQFMYRYFRDHGFACASTNYRLAGEASFPAAIEDVKAAVRFLGQHGDEYGYDVSKTAIWGESAGGYLAVMTAVSAPDAFDGVNCIGETADSHFPQVRISALVDNYGVMDFPAMSPEFEKQGIPKFIRNIANSWLDTGDTGFTSCEELWMNKAFSDWTDEEKQISSVWWHAAQGKSENMGLRTLILHGDADMTVPYAQSVELHRIMAEQYGSENVTLELFHGCSHAGDRFYSPEQLARVEQFIRGSQNTE